MELCNYICIRKKVGGEVGRIVPVAFISFIRKESLPRRLQKISPYIFSAVTGSHGHFWWKRKLGTKQAKQNKTVTNMCTNIDLLLEPRHAAAQNKMKVLLVWKKGRRDIE